MTGIACVALQGGLGLGKSAYITVLTLSLVLPPPHARCGTGLPRMIRFTQHARVAIRERGISLAWVRRTVDHPDRLDSAADGTLHYAARITERGGRWLRVIAVRDQDDVRVVTAFFDRRLARAPE